MRFFADATRAGEKLEEPENPARHRSRSPIWKRDAPLDATTPERPHVPSLRRLMLSRLVQPTRLFRHAPPSLEISPLWLYINLETLICFTQISGNVDIAFEPKIISISMFLNLLNEF